MNIPNAILAQQTWSDAQLEQLSLLMAVASQMPAMSLPLTMPGMPSNTFVGNMSALHSDSATDVTQTAPNYSSQFLPIQTVDVLSSGSSIQRATRMDRHIPDGKRAIIYQEPDVKSLTFDPAYGYRFDPSTGLHYDANSGLFINKKLGILLKYDKLTSTYERAGSTADITAPLLAKEFAELMGYDVAQTPGARALEAAPPTLPATRPSRWTPSPHTKAPGSSTSSSSDEEKRSPRRDHSLSPRSGRVQRRSSSDDRSKRGRKRNGSRSRSRSKSISSPRKRRSRKDRSTSKSTDQGNKEGGNAFEETLNSIARIHGRNLKNPDNVFGRFWPPTFGLAGGTQLQYILVTPLPPKGDRKWGDLEILFEGILKTNAVPYENVSVFPQNGNAPCDHCIIRFRKPHDAVRWYLIHQGVLELANPDGSKCPSYMYFSRLPWKCGLCKESNFPLRFFCYGCLKPQKILKEMEARAPLIESKVDWYKWVGVRNLDCQIRSTQDVLESLPPLDSFDIVSCEYMTEESGLPLGLCIFELVDKPSAKEFHKFLKNLNFDPVFLLVNSRVGLSKNPYTPIKSESAQTKFGWVDRSAHQVILAGTEARSCRPGSSQNVNPVRKTANSYRQRQPPKNHRRHQETQTTLTNIKGLSDYILRNWDVDTKVRDQKGTQTVLVYKLL